jgi:type I restriction enzyme S subunit
MCGNRAVINIEVENEVSDTMFIFYSLLFRKNLIEQLGTGSVQKNLYISVLGDLEIDLPPLSTQRRIVDILSALDEKIELNRQTNATLEAIAQSIFREWFVEFNPLSLPRLEGLQDYHDNAVKGQGNQANQENQGKDMVESELGIASTTLSTRIPKGWRVGKLGEVCEFAYGKGLKSENRVEGNFPVVGSNGIVGIHNEYLVEGPGIVIGRKGTIGEVTWVNKNFFPIDTTFYIKDLLGVKALYFHYFLLKEQDFKKIGSDSAVPGLNRNQAYDNIVVIPSLDLINQFNEVMVSIFEDIYNNEQQSATLASLRDALLPKLMSGEVEVMS